MAAAGSTPGRGTRQLELALVDNVAKRGECDFVVDIASELPLQAIAELMGVPQEDRHKIFDWSNRALMSVGMCAGAMQFTRMP